MPVIDDIDINSQLGVEAAGVGARPAPPVDDASPTAQAGDGRGFSITPASRPGKGAGPKSAPNGRLDGRAAGLRKPGLLGNDGEPIYLIAIIAAAVLLRMALLWLGPMTDATRAQTPDTGTYVAIADQLLSDQRFARELPVAEGAAARDAAVTPSGYVEAADRVAVAQQLRRNHAGRGIPMASATGADGGEVVYETGVSPVMPALMSVIRHVGLPPSTLLLINVPAMALSVFFAYGIALSLSGRTLGALIAASLLALHPAAVTHSLILSETSVLTLLVLAGLYGATRLRGALLLPAACGALCFGIASLMQPAALGVAAVAAAWRVARIGDVQSRRVAVLAAAAVVLLAATPPTLWSLRNHQLGAGHVVSTRLTGALALGVAAQQEFPEAVSEVEATRLQWLALHGIEQAPVDAAHAFIDSIDGPEDTTTPLVSLHRLRKVAHESMMAHPGALIGDAIGRTVDLNLSHSLRTLMRAMGVPYSNGGILASVLDGGFDADAPRATQGELATTGAGSALGIGVLGDIWILLNVLLLSAMLLGSMFLLLRRRFGLVATCAAPMLLWAWLLPHSSGEALGLVLVPLQAVLCIGFLIPARASRARKLYFGKNGDRVRLGDFSTPQPEGGFTIGQRGLAGGVSVDFGPSPEAAVNQAAARAKRPDPVPLSSLQPGASTPSAPASAAPPILPAAAGRIPSLAPAKPIPTLPKAPPAA